MGARPLEILRCLRPGDVLQEFKVEWVIDSQDAKVGENTRESNSAPHFTEEI